MWLDSRESIHLSPRGTIDLFRLLHEHGDDPRHTVARAQACPHCGARLNLLHDIGKGGRFSYYACPEWHGRLTPFSEFLKEKQFVRALSPMEREKVKAQLKQVQCSGCGAPVDLVGGFECGHCGSPITVLDAEAVEQTIRDLEKRDEQRSAHPEETRLRAAALASIEATRTDPDGLYRSFGASRHAGGRGLATDLLTLSVELLFGRR